MQPLQSVTGMNDILPAESARWRRLEQNWHETCRRYGFGEVRTPLCEYTELFVRSVGETTDIVEKEMYTFPDRNERSLTLRPEGTASAVRAYLHGAAGTEPLARWYYLGAMFRGERPQKGRYRQFHQVGAEVYGDAGPGVDAEVVDLAYRYVASLGVAKFEVRINSLGSGDTRTRYRDALVAYYGPMREKLSKESQRRLDTNPLRIVDSKSPEDVALRAGAPALTEHLADDDKRHFDAVLAILDRMGTPVVIDPTIVRGLDYYTRTIFELKDTSGALGAQDTLGGGGRYDNLVEELGGRSTPGIGFALGCERLLIASTALDAPIEPSAAIIAIARAEDVAVQAEALSIARELRTAGVTVHVDTRFGKADRQFRHADRVGARAGVVLGSAEIANGTLGLKDLARKEQRSIARADVVREVRALLSSPTDVARGTAD